MDAALEDRAEPEQSLSENTKKIRLRGSESGFVLITEKKLLKENTRGVKDKPETSINFRGP